MRAKLQIRKIFSLLLLKLDVKTCLSQKKMAQNIVNKLAFNDVPGHWTIYPRFIYLWSKGAARLGCLSGLVGIFSRRYVVMDKI